MYRAHGKQIMYHHRCGDVDLRAECDTAEKAAHFLNRAGAVNDKRHYTQAARLIARAESLPGFVWVDGVQS